jgi:predicted nuclease of predicted toxin-antitoxin system
MKILVDMNLSPRWVELLAGAGLDATHWSTIGEPHAPDSEIMA